MFFVVMEGVLFLLLLGEIIADFTQGDTPGPSQDAGCLRGNLMKLRHATLYLRLLLYQV